VIIPTPEADTTPSEWMFVCGVKADYAQLHEYMTKNGVDIRPFFYDIGRHAHLSDVQHSTMELTHSFFMLPSYPDLTTRQIETVCSNIITFLHERT
jgi:dTDP-4-amino-4,6-dideoxygalactose transaminase